MPGLTVNPEAVSPRTGAGGAGSSSGLDGRTAPLQPQPQPPPPPQPVSTTYVPPPIPPTGYPPRPPPIQTNTHAQAQAQAQAQAKPQAKTSRPSSPVRPPISPITPTLAPRQLPSSKASTTTTAAAAAPSFAQGRPAFTHSQPDQVAVPAPPPVPLDFESNPDVLALKSAIGILQLQRQRATADIQALGRAKDSALAQPAAFLSDLDAGRVGTEGDRLFVSAQGGGGAADDNDDDDDDSSDSDSDAEAGGAAGDGGLEGPGLKPSPMKLGGSKGKGSEKPAWASLPKPQNVVRCPPINWSQYAVVGESLDKLHNEQLSRPSQGSPAVIGSQGTYQFKGEARAGDGQKLVGIAAPYTPGRDKLDKKAKGAKR